MTKVLTILSLLALSCSIVSSCSKDDTSCVDDVLGIYTGNCSSNTGTFQGDVTINQSSNGTSSDLLIRDALLDGGITVYDGQLSPNCRNITIPLQSLIFNNGLAAQISGSYQIVGTSLTGNLNISVGGVGTICSYNLQKR